MAIKHPTPLLDQLETGPWPSFVSDIKQEAEYRAANPDNVEFQVPADAPDDLLGVLELSYKEGETHWKHGGIVGVFGYGGGVIGRYCDQPEMFPGVAHFHTVRVAQPSGKYYSTEFLRGLCDIWELRGSGLTNMHGSTGDIVLIGTQTPQLEEIFYDLTHKLDVDLGGSGSNLRTPAACLGQSRCEYACYNTQDACYQLTMDYQDELHRPAFPYKFKFKFDGCPNGCVCAMARSDFAVLGTQVGAGTTEVDVQLVGQVVEDFFQLRGLGAQEHDVTGGTVHVGHTGTAQIPDVAQVTQELGVVVFGSGLATRMVWKWATPGNFSGWSQ